MSILEATRSMLGELSEDDLKAVHDITYRFYVREKNPFTKVAKDKVLRDLAISRKQIANGQFKDFDETIMKIEGKYGL